MQLIEDTTNETLQQQQYKQQQQQQQTISLTSGKMHKFYPPKPKINAFNDLFTCSLCQGYMINPTAIDVCMHTYCRSCIVSHLATDSYCPQCKLSGGKAVNTTNLKSDEILRSIIYKLVPGLYQKECERLQQFVKNAKNEGNPSSPTTEQNLNELLAADDNDFFSPSEPISLSLEFHPVLAEQCPEDLVPAVRYLQCPASVKVQHLKRFLCTKFNIDPSNRRVAIDIIYEDEILPSDFTLMDIGYCYHWQSNAPLKLTYRILIYNEDMPADHSVNKRDVEKPAPNKTVSFAVNGEEQKSLTQEPKQAKFSNKSAPPSTLNKSSLHHQSEVPVKVTIPRKSTMDSKKPVSKKSSALNVDEFVVPTTTTNDFKSLRSNDIRYSNYTISSTSTPTTTPTSTTTPTLNTNTTTYSVPVPVVKKEKLALKEEKLSKCDIVVSIPHNQMQDEWDSKPLSELKTASKKSPNSVNNNDVTKTTVNAAPPAVKKNRNVPKLKIELNSLKTKLIEKPKSADIRLDTLMLKQHHRPRKFSLDEPQPVVDKSTYVKNIGLKPIEIQTPNNPETPNASPMSSSSSNTSSSNGNFNFNGSNDISSSSSSSHKKRKKKHSKDSRESKDSKRKKMHAEISSHSAEESLKMKVKLTPPINLKKLESKKSPPFGGVVIGEKSSETSCKTETKSLAYDKNKELKKSKSVDCKYNKNFQDKLAPLEIKTVFTSPAVTGNKPLTKDFDDDEADLTIPDSTSLSLHKPLNSIKETPLPQSPPLPPSLFKTTTLTFPPFTPTLTTAAIKPKPIVMPKDSKEKPKTTQMKLIAPKPIAPKLLQPSTFKPAQFAVPNPPTTTRFMGSSSNTSKFLSTPTSIASNLLKRSVSLDEHKHCGPGPTLSKQSRLEKPNQITVSAYGSNLHMTKVEIPATPTSSTAKATFEIPLYSPLSAAYNPKCSFTVNNSTTVAVSKTTKIGVTNHSLTAQKTNNRQAMDNKKCTASEASSTSRSLSHCKPSGVTTTTSNSNNTTATTTPTLMGPPKPMQKLNSPASLVPITMKSPPLSKAQTASTTNSNSVKTTATAVLGTASLSMVNYKQSKVLLAHVKPTNLSDLKIETTATTTATATAATTATTAAASPTTPLSSTTKTTMQATTNGLSVEKPKTSSLREFRLPSRESASDILDLSSATTKTSTNGLTDMPNTATSTTHLTPNLTSTISSSSSTLTPSSTGSSTLEMTLNKIKQNMSATTTTVMSTSTTASNANNASVTSQHNIIGLHYPTSLDKTTKKSDLATSSSSLAPIADDLQNLHLLSESATAREKIAISSASTTACSSSSAATTTTPTSPYEKVKITQNTLVRQQNASVRNIPNPSALAFRNQQPAVTLLPPMVTIAPGIANKLNDLDKPLLLKTPSPPKSPHSSSSSSSTSPSRTMTKKHPSIDQVAASLNMRASAAAEASAKAHSKLSHDETSLVTSTSSLDGKQIKQESGEMVKQSDAASAAQPSSTTSSVNASSSSSSPRALTNNHLSVEIKKEPDDRVDDSCDVKMMGFVNATPTTTTTPNKSSMVENLVTSVINVTAAPTTKLLTAATSVGY